MSYITTHYREDQRRKRRHVPVKIVTKWGFSLHNVHVRVHVHMYMYMYIVHAHVQCTVTEVHVLCTVQNSTE